MLVDEKEVCASCKKLSQLARTDSRGILGMINKITKDLEVLKAKIEDSSLSNS